MSNKLLKQKNQLEKDLEDLSKDELNDIKKELENKTFCSERDIIELNKIDSLLKKKESESFESEDIDSENLESDELQNNDYEDLEEEDIESEGQDSEDIDSEFEETEPEEKDIELNDEFGQEFKQSKYKNSLQKEREKVIQNGGNIYPTRKEYKKMMNNLNKKEEKLKKDTEKESSKKENLNNDNKFQILFIATLVMFLILGTIGFGFYGYLKTKDEKINTENRIEKIAKKESYEKESKKNSDENEDSDLDNESESSSEEDSSDTSVSLEKIKDYDENESEETDSTLNQEKDQSEKTKKEDSKKENNKTKNGQNNHFTTINEAINYGTQKVNAGEASNYVVVNDGTGGYICQLQLN